MIPLHPHAVISAIALVVWTSYLAVPAAAQQTGRISGSVIDQTGAALAGVAVSVHGEETREGQTDAAGAFDFPDLRPGQYRVSLNRSGFSSIERLVGVEHGALVVLD